MGSDREGNGVSDSIINSLAGFGGVTFKSLVENLNDGFVVIDKQRRIIFANAKFASMFGYSVDEVMGKDGFFFLDEKNRQKLTEELKKRARGESSVYELVMTTRSREKIPVLLRATPILDEKGAHMGSYALITDMTERKRMEAEIQNYTRQLEKMVVERTQELVKSENKYRNLIETSHDAIFVLNLDGRFAFVNDRAAELSGYSKEEALKMRFTDVIAPEYRESTAERFKRHLGDPSTYRYETQILTKAGRRIDLELATTPLREGDRIIAIQGIARDITERKRQEGEKEAIAEIDRLVATSPLETSYDGFSRALKRVIPHDGMCIVLYNKRSDAFEIYAVVRDFKIKEFEVGQRIPRSGSVQGAVFDAKDTIVINHLSRSGSYEEKILYRAGLRSLISSPLLHKGAIIGTIDFCSKNPNNFTSLHMEFLNQISSQLAVIVENSRNLRALATSEEEWRKTFDSVPDLISIHDRDFRILRVNKALEDKFGVPREQLVGKHCYEVFHARDKPWPNCPFQKTLATGETAIEDVDDPSLGGIFSMATSPIFEDGGIIGSVHVCRDITQRKRMEEEVLNSRGFLNNILESSADSIITTNMDGKITSWSRGAEKIYGYRAADMIGRDILELYPPHLKEERIKWFDELLAGKDVKDVRTTIYRADGSLATITLSLALLRDSNGQPMGTVGISKDITDHVKAEEELKKTHTELANRIKELEKFAKHAIGRELRMIELKNRIKELEQRLAEHEGKS